MVIDFEWCLALSLSDCSQMYVSFVKSAKTVQHWIFTKLCMTYAVLTVHALLKILMTFTNANWLKTHNFLSDNFSFQVNQHCALRFACALQAMPTSMHVKCLGSNKSGKANSEALTPGSHNKTVRTLKWI